MEVVQEGCDAGAAGERIMVERGEEKFCRMTPDDHVCSSLAQFEEKRKNKTVWKRLRNGLSKFGRKTAGDDDAMDGKKKQKRNLKNWLGFNKMKKTEHVEPSETKSILHNVQIGSKIVNVIWPGYTPIMLKNYIGMSDIDELYRMHNVQDPVATTSHDPGQVEEKDEVTVDPCGAEELSRKQLEDAAIAAWSKTEVLEATGKEAIACWAKFEVEMKPSTEDVAISKFGADFSQTAGLSCSDSKGVRTEEIAEKERAPETPIGTIESQEDGDVRKPTACCEKSDENKGGRSASLDHAESREDAAAEEAVIDKKTKKKMNLFKRMFKKSKKASKESTKTAPEQINDAKQSTENANAIEDQEPCMGKAESRMKPKRRKTFGDIFKRK